MENWITVQPTAGTPTTGAPVDVSAQFNSGNDRSTRLTCTATKFGASVSVIVDLSQLKAMEVSPSSITYDQSGGTHSITIVSNGPWTASTDAGWLTFKHSASEITGGSGTTIITVAAREDYDDDRSTVIYITNGTIIETVTVTQPGDLHILNVVPSAATIGQTSGVVTFTITSNHPWTASIPQSFATLSQASGDTGVTVITAIVEENDTYNIRAFRLRVTDGIITRVVQVNQEGKDQWLEELFTIEIVSAGTLVITTHKGGASNRQLSYSYNGGATWEHINGGGAIQKTYNCSVGTTFMFKGRNADIGWCNNYGHLTFEGTSYFNFRGNVTSLFNYGDFSNIPTSYSLETTFQGTYHLVSAKNLRIPDFRSDGPGNCYRAFYNCFNLTEAPSKLCNLREEKFGLGIFQEMFRDCKSLISPPVLPATTLTDYCYISMFSGCTSLTTAPELPATTLVSNCYNGMFERCTSLNYIKCLAIDMSALNCTSIWVNRVPSSGTFVKDPTATWSTGVSGIPSGWTVVNN